MSVALIPRISPAYLEYNLILNFQQTSHIVLLSLLLFWTKLLETRNSCKIFRYSKSLGKNYRREISQVVSAEEFVSNFNEHNQAFPKLAYTVKDLTLGIIHLVTFFWKDKFL